MRMLPRTFEIQNRIDDVFQGFWPRDRTILRDVADQKNRNMILLGPEQQLRCNFAHLADAARRHFESFAECRLNGINDDNFRFETFGRTQNLFHRHLGVNVETVRLQIQALAPQFDLLSGFLTRRIEDYGRIRQVGCNAEHKRRFANARIPTQKHQRARNDTASKHTIELADTCGILFR